MTNNATIRDIIAEKRALADGLEHEMAKQKECKELMIAHRTAQAIIDNTRRDANRLEAALKREREELEAKIADLQARVKLWTDRSAELVEACNKHYANANRSAVGDAAKLREALQQIADICDGADTGGLDERTAIYNIAKAALAVLLRNKENPMLTNNKLREALEATNKFLESAITDGKVTAQDITALRNIVSAARSEPIRNCDRFGGDYKKLNAAWFDWTGTPDGQNADGTVKLTFAEWLLAPATEKEGNGK